jgi:hypothetical protein
MRCKVLVIYAKVICPVLGAEALYYCTLVSNDEGSSYPGIIAVPKFSNPHSIAIACCMVEIYLLFWSLLLEILVIR